MKPRLSAILGLAALGLAALFAPARSEAADDEQVVRIGHAAPTRGWLARVGTENEIAAKVAIDELNRRALRLGTRRLRFELVPADDAGEPARAREAAQTLVDAGVVAVVGHLLSSASMAAAPVYAAAGIAQVSPSTTAAGFTRSAWPTAFRMLADDERMNALLARHAVQVLGVRRVALVHAVEGGGSDKNVAESFGQALQAEGGQAIGAWPMGPTVADWGPLVRELAALAPDAVFFAGLDRHGGRLLQLMHRAGLHARFISGDTNCTPDLVSYWATGAAEDDQVLCALPAGVQGLGGPAMEAFAAAFRARAGVPAEFYGAYAYDAVMVLADALLRAADTSPPALRRALADTRDRPGLTGPIGFDARGDLVGAAVSLFTYRDEQRVLLRTLR
jgi:branched-chain amino acid transport system substrate-binding protein